MMDNDLNGDEAMQRFEDLGRKLFRPLKDDDSGEATEEESEADE